MNNLIPLLIDHIILSVGGVLLAAVIGICIGILIAKHPMIAGPILSIADIIQTIPSLALLTIIMFFFGLGKTTMIVGICLYSLLPIIRNTYTGIRSVDAGILDAAKGMGMNIRQSLMKVELPLAFPLILSGIRIALVTALGIAVMGVLIGAGGLGEIVMRGIQTLNFNLIITGALPVCILSIGFEWVFEKLEKRVTV